MPPFSRGRLVALGLFLLVILAGGAWFFFRAPKPAPVPETKTRVVVSPERTIGASVEGRPIKAYTYGSGPTRLLFVGGMHGGYEWNSVLLAYRFMDYLDTNPGEIPLNLSITVIPELNIDGVYTVTQKEGRFNITDVSTDTSVERAGRFNAHGVDLNRNFDCKWQPKSTWQSKTVSAGSAPFSEPEAQALKNFVLAEHPAGVVFWHSQANAVYASECEHGILAGTRALMGAYAHAAGYPAVDSFDAYAVTGDSEGWLASIGIPAVTVELKTHETVEWEKNLAGIKATLALYSNSQTAY